MKRLFIVFLCLFFIGCATTPVYFMQQYDLPGSFNIKSIQKDIEFYVNLNRFYQIQEDDEYITAVQAIPYNKGALKVDDKDKVNAEFFIKNPRKLFYRLLVFLEYESNRSKGQDIIQLYEGDLSVNTVKYALPVEKNSIYEVRFVILGSKDNTILTIGKYKYNTKGVKTK